MFGILTLFGLPSFLIFIDFIVYLIKGKRWLNIILIRIFEYISIIALPCFFLFWVDGHQNSCCGDSASFSPEHRLSILVLIVICILAYFYSSYKTLIHSPILEVLTNSILLIGLILNIFISVQLEEYLWLFGNLPICILFAIQLIKNHKRFIEFNGTNELTAKHKLEKMAWSILKLKSVVKFPILILLCLPILVLISSFLLLFGQKPDSIIKAFTDTYKHGFSELDHLCDNVKCGGHFLCSVAANGHNQLVKPIRYGTRAGGKIICNRQLLIANAFEELIEQKFPSLHKIIRHNYNKVGDVVHQYYSIFNHKLISDLVYVVMKPLEIFFLIFLYTFDAKPENRIAQQYLDRNDRTFLKQKLH